jgi:hypothetical protein
MDHQTIMSLLSFAICSGIGFVCVCRLNSPICKSSNLLATRYALVLTGATAYGFQPILFKTYPNEAGIFFIACVLVSLVLNLERWTRLDAATQSKAV